jgi:hypothetical protein
MRTVKDKEDVEEEKPKGWINASCKICRLSTYGITSSFKLCTYVPYYISTLWPQVSRQEGNSQHYSSCNQCARTIVHI